MSDPLPVETTLTYFQEHYSAPSESLYLTESGKSEGMFFGELAREWGLLDKPVTAEIMERLGNGQDPNTGQVLIKHRKPAQIEPWAKTQDAWHSHLEERFLATGSDQWFRDVDKREGWRWTEPSSPEEKAVTPPRTEREKALIDLHERAAQFYQDRLAGESGAIGRRYLKFRQFNETTLQTFGDRLGGAGGEIGRRYLKFRQLNEDTMQTFRVGLAGSRDELYQHLRHCDRELLEASGLFRRDNGGRIYDFFRDRIVMPIQAADGSIVGFLAGAMNDKAFVDQLLAERVVLSDRELRMLDPESRAS